MGRVEVLSDAVCGDAAREGLVVDLHQQPNPPACLSCGQDGYQFVNDHVGMPSLQQIVMVAGHLLNL
jgi:hypothetical protein